MVNVAPRLAQTFKINDLLATNASRISIGTVAGDDRTAIAVSHTQVFVTADGDGTPDGRTVKFAINDLSGGVATGGPFLDALITDVGKGLVFTLGTDATTPYLSDTGGIGSTVTHLLAVDSATGLLTGDAIPLSSSILVPGFGAQGLFSGAGHTVVFTDPDGVGASSGEAYDINLSTGQVTDLGGLAIPNLSVSEETFTHGVLEDFGGELYLDYHSNAGDNTIERVRVSDGVTSTVASFTSISDLQAFTVAPELNRWYFHFEGETQFGGEAAAGNDNESLAYADAHFDLQAPWDSPTFTESAVQAGPELIDTDVTLVDPDSSFQSGSLNITYISGGFATESIGIRNQGTGAGQIGVSGASVSYGGVTFGTVTVNGNAGADLAVTFNANASRAAVEALIENLTYANTSDAPSASRILALTLNDGNGGSAGAVTSTISVTPEDDLGAAKEDAFNTTEAALISGNLFSDNGSGADADPDTPLAVVKINGETAAVGTTFALSSGASVKANADGTFTYNPNHAFDTLSAPGSGASNTSVDDGFVYTLAGGEDAAVHIHLVGLDSDDIAQGTKGADKINAGKGSDLVLGIGGNDTLNGGSGGDSVSGGSGKDTVIGGNGGDELSGGKGNDVVKGGRGADTLIGGKGADELDVGNDNKSDRVAYFTKSESKGSNPDRVLHFDTHGENPKGSDKIDLSALDADKQQKDDQEFRFVDQFSKAEGKEPDGQVRVEDAGKDQKVLVDLNGDNHTDMVIVVVHVHDLSKADFIL